MILIIFLVLGLWVLYKGYESYKKNSYSPDDNFIDATIKILKEKI